jgi:hypothetical protein
MTSIEEREKNLCNATDTLAQFYDEIESFMDILSGKMERRGYPASEERLRSGTLGIRNLPRRLLASAMVMFVNKEKGIEDTAEDDEADEELEKEGGEIFKPGKKELTITPDLRIPFVSLFLFSPKTIPSVRTLESPQLLLGALGNMRFVEKKTGEPGNPASPLLALSNLVQIRVPPDSKVGGTVRVDCGGKAMGRYRLEAALVRFESRRLLEIDSEEKIGEIADKLAEFCKQ